MASRGEVLMNKEWVIYANEREGFWGVGGS